MSSRSLFSVVTGSILALALFGSAPSVKAAVILYGITFDNELIAIDTSSGAGTLIGNLSTPMAAMGLGTRGGKLYTFDQQADRVRELSIATGATLNTYNVGLGVVGEGGLTFRSDGLGFLSVSSGGTGTLYTFNLDTLTSATVGGLSASMDGIDFSPGGVLFGISQNTAILHTINPATAATTVIGDTGFDTTDLSGLAFRDDGALFTVINDALFSVDSVTGAATRIGPIGFDKVSGLTFVQASGVPDSGASVVLLGFALMAMAAVSRFRRDR